MKTIEQYKAAAVYFKPGRIVPNWLLRINKGNKQLKRRITFGGPVWVLPCGDRHIIWGSTELPGTSIIYMKDVNDVDLGTMGGMQNIFVLNGVEPVEAHAIYKEIHAPLVKTGCIRLGQRVKNKGTKLQRRRAKLAAKRATQTTMEKQGCGDTR